MKYYDDTPVYKLTDDKLGRAHHSRRLARMIVDVSVPDTSYVIGVYGPWGSGKSSFLNFIQEELKRIEKTEKHSHRVETFAPWSFSSSDDILEELAGLLAPPTCQEQQEQSFFESTSQDLLIIAIGAFVLTLVLYLGLGFERAADFLIAFYALLGFIIGRRALGLTPRDAKERIKAMGVSGQTKTIIFIDEIDRWDRDSTRDLMRFIRVNSDLKNIVFILAFDPVIVAQHLTDNNVDGRRYLEKIVQFPYDLPAVAEWSHNQYIRHELEELFNKFRNLSAVEDACWELFQRKGILSLFINVRQLRRVQNSLMLQLSSIKREINIPVFVLFEIFRINYPSLHRWIYNNLQHLLGRNTLINDATDFKSLNRSLEQEFLERIPLDDKTGQVLIELIQSVFRLRENVDIAWFEERGSLRATLDVPETQDAFARYFTFSVPPTQLSATDFERILDNVTPSELEKIIFISRGYEKLKYEIAQHRMRDFLEKIVGELKNKKMDPKEIIELVWCFPVESFNPDFQQSTTPLSTGTPDSYHPLGHSFFTFLNEAVKWWQTLNGREIDETIVYWKENGIPLSVILHIFKEEIVELRDSISEYFPRTLTCYKEAICGEHILTALDVPYLLKFKPLFFDNDKNAEWVNVLGRLLNSDEKFIMFLERISYQQRQFAEDMRNGPILRSHFPENLIPEVFEDPEKVRSRLASLKALKDPDLAERADQLLELYTRRGRD